MVYMREEIDFQEAIDMIGKWDDYHRKEFYDSFPDTVEREARYDLMGLRQHEEEEGFATEFEGEELETDDIDSDTKKLFKSQLSNLSATAGREAASAQNITVYNHAMTLWDEAEDTSELLRYLEVYAAERTGWNERKGLQEQEEGPIIPPSVQYGAGEDEEYVKDILTKLVTDTMHEV